MDAIQKRLRSKTIHYWVALCNGHTIGFIDYQLLRSRAKILGLAVIEEFRGQGIGQKLLKKALAEAKNAGKKEAFLLTAVVYPEARHLYEKFGFKQAGKLNRKLWGQEVVILTKKL